MAKPLPDPKARRRNAPTIPTTELPAGGRKGRRPKPPARIELGPAGDEWWRWAWGTPQAAAWDGGGFDEVIARRAALEDDLAALAAVEGLDALAFLDALEHDDRRAAEGLVRSLAGLATGKLALVREARELDDRLGLTPKGMAALRWRVVHAADTEAPSTVDEVQARREARRARALADETPPAKPKPKPKPRTAKAKS